MRPLVRETKEPSITSETLWLEMCDLKLVMKKHQAASDSDILPITGLKFSKVSRTWMLRKDWGTVPD